MSKQASTKGAALSAVPAARAELSQQERLELQATWPMRQCEHCGTAHGGTCPRVKRITRARQGPTIISEDIVFWPNGKWEPPADALTVFDVWETPVVPLGPPTGEAAPKRKKAKA